MKRSHEIDTSSSKEPSKAPKLSDNNQLEKSKQIQSDNPKPRLIDQILYQEFSTREANCDRFIPNRSQINHFDSHGAKEALSTTPNEHCKLIIENLFDTPAKDMLKQRVYSFSKPPAGLFDNYYSSSTPKIIEKSPNSVKKVRCLIDYKKKLDVPGLPNDFYLNLLSWSATDQIFVPVETDCDDFQIVSTDVNKTEEINFFKEVNRKPTVVAAFGDQQVISGWENHALILDTLAAREKHLGVIPYNLLGMSAGENINSLVVTGAHTFMVGSTLSRLMQLDLRERPGSSKLSYQMMRTTHSTDARIIGLTYNQGHYIAEGNCQGCVAIWDIRHLSQTSTPVYKNYLHQGSVKGLAFHPTHTNLLASGGGRACRKLSFWNISTNNLSKGPDTGSQISGVHWLAADPRYLWTTHGDSSPGLKLWRVNCHDKPMTCQEEGSYKTEPNEKMISSAISTKENRIAAISTRETLSFFTAKGPKERAFSSSTKEPVPTLRSFRDPHRLIR